MNSNKDECETILDDRNEHSWSHKVAGGNGERKLFLKQLASTFEEKPWLKRGKKKKKKKGRQTDKPWNQEWQEWQLKPKY